jgi:hypothetical protein
MRVAIDRFEGEFAVCENSHRRMINIEKSKLPASAKEGDVLILEGNTIKIDSSETTQRKKRIEKLADDLWK